MPDPSLPIADGALVPWSVGGSSRCYEPVIQAMADRYEIDIDEAVVGAHRGGAEPLPLRHRRRAIYVQYRNRMGRQRQYKLAFDGIVAASSAATRRPTGRGSGSGSRSTCRYRPCPVCKGARLQARGARGHRRAQVDRTSSRGCRSRAALRFVGELGLTETEQLIGHRIVKEIRERLTFLDDVGVGYLDARPRGATLSGGEAQRMRLATQIGSQLVGVLYVLDEPSIGLHRATTRGSSRRSSGCATSATPSSSSSTTRR